MMLRHPFIRARISQACDRLGEVPELGEPVSPMIARFTKASMTMTIGHIMNDKIIKLAQLAKDDVEYAAMPSWISGTKGLSFTREGAAGLMTYLCRVTQKMQPPSGALFSKEWHTSRSAKTHARRKQVPLQATSGE